MRKKNLSASQMNWKLPANSISPREAASPIPRQLPLSPMRFFSRAIEHPFDVPVQRPHDSDARCNIRCAKKAGVEFHRGICLAFPPRLAQPHTAFTGHQQVLDNSTAAVDIGENCLPLPHNSFLPAAILGGCCALENEMASRPSDLAERMSNRHEPDSSSFRETFRLPVEVARVKAREILNQYPQGGYMTDLLSNGDN